MAWTYLQDMAVSPLAYQTGLDPSHTVKSTDTLKEFFSQEWLKDSYLMPLYGTILERLKENHSLEKSTSSMEVSHARTLAVREVVKAWKETEAVFSSNCVEWSKKSNPDSSFWKTSRPYELEDFEKSSTHLQIYGMTVGGLVFLPLNLVPHTLEKDGSYWQSPKAMMVEETYETYIARMKRSPDPKTNTKTRPSSLVVQVNTPKFWPTPMARDWKGTSGQYRHTQNLPNLVEKVGGGKLNPTWVEWLMGVPLGWTELKPWVMEWYRCKSKQRFKGS